MSVITSLTVTPNRMAIMYEYLSKREEGEDRERLGRLLMPEALRGSGGSMAIFQEVVAEAKALALVGEVDGRLVVPERMRPSGGRGFREIVEPLLLEPELATTAGQAGFAPSLAWFLAQDPERPLEWGQSQAGRIEEQCGSGAEKIEVGSIGCFQNFVYWARYIGYAWRLKAGGAAEVVMPDPTKAIERYLPDIFEGRTSMKLREFMRVLAERSPVFEGGETRTEVEAMGQASTRREGNTMSRSTTLALVRLEGKGLIKLESPADAAPVEVANLEWPTSRSVSEIVLVDRG